MDLKAYLNDRRQLVNAFIDNYFDSIIKPDQLKDSIIYSLSAGGKRIRPILCIASYEACGGRAEDIVPYASAIEFIHTYSLIHDDLPAMDNDDLRRGKPTNHRVFGEGMAILAGDGLLTETFYLLSSNPSNFDTKLVLEVINEIAISAGIKGMVGGQAADLIYETKEPDSETLCFIHTHKTASLIKASVKVGGILADCNDERLDSLTNYGEKIGLAFQIIDDILDVEGETEVIGKPKGSDEKKKKMTYPRLYGIDKSRQMASELIEKAIGALSLFDEKAGPLRWIARYLIERKS
ncbi:MAG: polyprenyl synthetase family protein [Thermodesulfovibrionales bacterium]